MGTVQRAKRPKFQQRFVTSWLQKFSPWLTRCYDNPDKPYCKICYSRLDPNRCHLERHERTTKHIENMNNLHHGSIRKPGVSLRQEKIRYYHQTKFLRNLPARGNDNAESKTYFRSDYHDNREISLTTKYNGGEKIEKYVRTEETTVEYQKTSEENIKYSSSTENFNEYMLIGEEEEGNDKLSFVELDSAELSVRAITTVGEYVVPFIVCFNVSCT